MRITSILLTMACLGNPIQSALAADEPATDEVQTTTTTVTEVTSNSIKNQLVSVKPQAGAAVFRDQFDTMSSRALYGIGVDANLIPGINKDWNSWYLGPSTGALYSHLGDPTSNFVGMNADRGYGAAGSNLLI